MHNVMCIRRRVRACKRLLEAAKTLTTRDHVRSISRLSTLFNNKFTTFYKLGEACLGYNRQLSKEISYKL
jgi:hypothetical protein